MAIPFLNNINLDDNELQNAKLHVTSSAPASEEGQIYFHSTNDVVNVHDGTTWQTLAYQSWVTSNFLSSATAFVDGSGTANYIPKWSDSDTLGDSQIFDNGTDVGINTASPNETLDVDGTLRSTGNAFFATGNTTSFIGIGSTSTTTAQLNLNTTTAASEVGVVNASNTLRLRVDSTDAKSIFLNNSGHVAFPAYGGGTITGTAASNLSVDSSGNIIETAIAAAADASITIGDSTIALGGTDTTLTGLTDIDLTEANHTIFDGVGANNLTIGASNTTVIIAGDLTVSGTTTTVNTETINLADNIITLNSNYTGSTPSENGGIEIERGTLDNVALRWNESTSRWQFTNDGTTYYNIPISSEYDNFNFNVEVGATSQEVSDGGTLTFAQGDGIGVTITSDDTITYSLAVDDLPSITGGTLVGVDTSSIFIPIHNQDTASPSRHESIELEQLFSARSKSVLIGNNSATTFNIQNSGATSPNKNHGLGVSSAGFIVQLVDTSTGETVHADVTRGASGLITIEFSSAPATNGIRVLIHNAL